MKALKYLKEKLTKLCMSFNYPFACRNELGLIVQKQFTLSLILNN